VVYRRKTFSSDFRFFCRPIFFHQESSAEIETNGSQMVQGPMDHQNFPTKLPQFLARHQRCMWSGVVMMEDNTFSVYQYSGRFSLIASCNLFSCE